MTSGMRTVIYPVKDIVMATAEAVRLNPASTDAQLRAQRNILQHLNGD